MGSAAACTFADERDTREGLAFVLNSNGKSQGD